MPKKQGIYPSHQQPQFSIRIPAELLDDIDIYCQREGISKRDFAIAIFRKWLDSGKHIADDHIASKDEIQQLREEFDHRLTALEQKMKGEHVNFVICRFVLGASSSPECLGGRDAYPTRNYNFCKTDMLPNESGLNG